MSNHKDGQTLYGTVDLGFNLVRNHAVRVGVFAGYHYFQQQVSAYGCAQVATNPLVCGGGGVPYNIRVITQDNTFHSLRIGIDADIRLSDRLSLRLDARLSAACDPAWRGFALAADRHLSPEILPARSGKTARVTAISSRPRINYAVDRNVSLRAWRPLLAPADQGRHAFRRQCRRLCSVAAAGRLENRYLWRVRPGLVQIRPLCCRRAVSELGCGGRIAGVTSAR